MRRDPCRSGKPEEIGTIAGHHLCRRGRAAGPQLPKCAIVVKLAGKRDRKGYWPAATVPLGDRDLVTAEHVHGKTGWNGPPAGALQMSLAEVGTR